LGPESSRISEFEESKMKAALYARVSSEDQAREEKVSLDTQIGDIEAYCKAKGYELVKRYVDVQSGSDTMKNRPQFEKMLADAEKGLFNVIVAWQPDRLFRSMYPAARLKRTLDQTSIEIEAVKQPLDKKLLGIWAWVAEMEIENFKERSMMGKRGIARKGLVVTRQAPYGYYVDKDRHPQILEEEAYVVRRIFREYAIENKPVQSIADDLNTESVLTRTDAQFGWSAVYIHRILKDEVYIGRGTYGRHRHTYGRRTKQPEENQIVVPFPPLIDKGTFQIAQERKAHTINRRRRHYQVLYLLRDIAYCKECGHKLIPRTTWHHKTVRKSGKVYEYYYDPPLRYYTCFGMHRYPHHFYCREPGAIKAQEVEDLVWNKLVEVVENPALIAQGIQSCQEQKAGGGLIRELESAKRQASELGLKKHKAIDLQIRGLITEKDLAIQLKFINERLEFFEAEVARLSEEVAKIQQSQMNFTNLEQVSAQIKARLNGITEEDRAELVRLLIHRVWADGKGNIIIEFAVPQSVPEGIPSLCNADMEPRDGDNMRCPRL